MGLMRNRWLVAGGLLITLAQACDGCDVENVDDTPGTLRGQACHQITGRPSIGAAVTVTSERSSGTIEVTAVTDNEGRFELPNVPPGTPTIHIAGEGINITVPGPTILSNQVTEWLDPACIDPTLLLGKGCVAGQVCNRHTGMMVNDAEVTVVLSNVNGTGVGDLTATTNAQGVFQICNVPSGNHTVNVRAVGFQRAYPANVVEGMTTEITSAPQCTPFDPSQHCIVRGRVCTPDTPPSWLPDARVTAQLLGADNNPVMPVVGAAQEEFTDADGQYELYLQPQGRWRVQVQKGNFISRTDVDCVVNETRVIPEGTQCVTASECRFLVASGIFDRVESVLSRVGVPPERMDVVNGNPPDLNDDWAFRAFGTAQSLNGYCGVFLNCGIDESAFKGPRANPVVIQNLKNFVEQGGTIYASDQSYDVIEALFPAKVDFFRNDDLASDAEFGLPGEYTADVTDDALRQYLQNETPGQSTVDIKFNYQSWVVMQQVDADVQVFLRGNIQACSDGEACMSSVLIPNTPLTIRYPVGSLGGQIIFTSFHVETRAPTDGGSGMVISTEDTDRVMRFLMTL